MHSIVSARAALAGNPSDGYGGAVTATMVPLFAATARIDDGLSVAPELVEATLERVRHALGAATMPAVRVETTIPQSVGLAGSSAIVTSTIHLLFQHHNVQIDPGRVAEIAYAVERLDMGIAGGWQDQLVQAHGVTALMEFKPQRTHRPLVTSARPPIPLFVAWTESGAGPSGQVHAALRSQPASHRFRGVMSALAEQARRCAAALEARDVHTVKESMHASLELRCEIMTPDPDSRALIDTARQLGAAPNLAGSGGAIVGVVPKNQDAFVSGIRQNGYRIGVWDLQ